MVDKSAALHARLQAARQGAGRAMWYMLTTDTVLDLLKEHRSLTIEMLRERLRARMEAADEQIMKDAALESLEQLAIRTQRD